MDELPGVPASSVPSEVSDAPAADEVPTVVHPAVVATMQAQLDEAIRDKARLEKTLNDMMQEMRIFKMALGKKDDVKDTNSEIKSINVFNMKDMPKPHQYAGDVSKLLSWSELFTAYMVSMDKQWGKILEGLRKDDCEPMTSEECADFQKSYKLSDEAREMSNHAL